MSAICCVDCGRFIDTVPLPDEKQKRCVVWDVCYDCQFDRVRRTGGIFKATACG